MSKKTKFSLLSWFASRKERKREYELAKLESGKRPVKKSGLGWFVFLFVLIMIAGTFAGISLYGTVTQRSSSYGTLYFDERTTTDVFSVEYSSVPFVASGNNYVFTDEFESLDFNGITTTNQMFLNQQESITESVGAGYIQSDFEIVFYNINGYDMTHAYIRVRLEFYSTQTTLTITSITGIESITYLNTYIAKNGLEIKVLEVNSYE